MKYEYKVVICEQDWKTGRTRYSSFIIGSNTPKDQEAWEKENGYCFNVVSYKQIKGD